MLPLRDLVEFQRPAIKCCRSLALHWGGRALRGVANSFAQRNADRQLRIQQGLMEDLGMGPRWSKLPKGYLQKTSKNYRHGLSRFPKEKDQIDFWTCRAHTDPGPPGGNELAEGTCFLKDEFFGLTGCLSQEQTHVKTMEIMKCDRAHAT